jgi:hypothetical protein
MTRLVQALVLVCAGDQDDLAPATGIVVGVLIMIAAVAIGFAAWAYLAGGV